MPRRSHALALGCALALSARALASPLGDPHVGGVGFGGPTEGELTAVFWNPAALGLLPGAQAMVSTSAQATRVTARRSPIDPATGLPGGARGFPAVVGRGTVHPASGPVGPGTFAAVGASIGNRFSLALAAYTPFLQQLSYRPGPGGEEPTRYHLVEADLRNVALVPALAFRVGSELRIGAAPGFLFSTGRLVLDEDTALAGGAGAAGLGADCGGAPCGAENPAAAARYDVASGLGVFDASLSFTLAGGVLWRRGPLAIGAAFSSRPLGNEGGGVDVDARRTRVRPAPRGAPVPACGGDRSDGCAYGEIRYDLPDTYTAGVTWQASPALGLTAIARYLTFSRHDRIDVRVTGPAPGLGAAGLPDRIVLHRGFTDTLELRLRAARAIGERVRVAATLRGQTAAVPAASLGPAAVDGPTLEPALAVEVRAGTWLRLAAGYAFAFSPVRATGPSAFDPAAAVACADAQDDLAHPACRARLRGEARPTAQGEYGRDRHAASLTATVRF